MVKRKINKALDVSSKLDENHAKIQKDAIKNIDKPEKKEAPDNEHDTKKLLFFIGIVIGIFLLFLLVSKFLNKPEIIMTIDEMHLANTQGTLDPEKGYIYNGFSFVNVGGLWYSQVQSGSNLYDITFNNDPKSVENISVSGKLSDLFARGNNLYITFDPYAVGIKYIAVANAGLSMSLVKGFDYNLTAGCNNNQSPTCSGDKYITCDQKDRGVIYFKESSETKITLEGNCVTIEGSGPDIVKAKDRLLLRWYGVSES